MCRRLNSVINTWFNLDLWVEALQQLNPEASPFSATPGAGPSHPIEGLPEGICFSIPSVLDEDGDEDDNLHWIPPCASPKGKSAAVVGRRRSTSPARTPDGFMADAHRSGHAPSRSFYPPLVDEEGFRRVVSRRRLRELLAVRPHPSVSADRSPRTWWGDASTAWPSTMWPHNASIPHDACGVRRLDMSPRTAIVLASQAFRSGAVVVLCDV